MNRSSRGVLIASAANSCQGQNACKGKAWIETSKAECEKKGGKIVESKKE